LGAKDKIRRESLQPDDKAEKTKRGLTGEQKTQGRGNGTNTITTVNQMFLLGKELPELPRGTKRGARPNAEESKSLRARKREAKIPANTITRA